MSKKISNIPLEHNPGTYEPPACGLEILSYLDFFSNISDMFQGSVGIFLDNCNFTGGIARLAGLQANGGGGQVKQTC